MRCDKRVHATSDELFQYQAENISIILLLSMVTLPNFFQLEELLYIDIKYIIYLEGFLHVAQPQKSKWNRSDYSMDLESLFMSLENCSSQISISLCQATPAAMLKTQEFSHWSLKEFQVSKNIRVEYKQLSKHNQRFN